MSYKWWMALTPSGKILSIVEVEEFSAATEPKMLPSCSNNDLPSWIPVINADVACAQLSECRQNQLRLRAALEHAASMAGHPDAAQGCRNIITLVRGVLEGEG